MALNMMAQLRTWGAREGMECFDTGCSMPQSIVAMRLSTHMHSHIHAHMHVCMSVHMSMYISMYVYSLLAQNNAPLPIPSLEHRDHYHGTAP